MKIVLINPNIVVQKNDPFTTGIPYMPVSLAYMAASLREYNLSPMVIDAFGLKPTAIREENSFYIQGLNTDEILDLIYSNSDVIFVYAGILTSHYSLVEIIKSIKKKYNNIPVVVVENTQAVTSYAIQNILEELFDIGADFILTGENEYRAKRLINALKENNNFNSIDGLAFKKDNKVILNPPEGFISDIDKLPFPAWDLFPLDNYWKIKYSHGPLQGKYLPLLTSRGCPLPCRFCVSPILNKNKWRFRSPQNVVDEMEKYKNKFNLDEFHIEDLNPFISEERIKEICKEILNRKLKIRWKIAAGTTIQTIKSKDTLKLLAEAGCKYISFSPETGSSKMLNLLGKKFDYEKALELVKYMNELRIKSQACFVLGFPEETKEDLEKTKNYVLRLTKSGVDEIALFIISPVPGSEIFPQFYGFENLSQLNFTPVWRDDYKQLNRFRLKLYISFILNKLRYYPGKIFKQSINFIRRKFETKMEMVPYKALKITYYALFCKISGVFK